MLIDDVKNKKEKPIVQILKTIQFVLLCFTVITIFGMILQISNIVMPPFADMLMKILISLGALFNDETYKIGVYQVHFAYLYTIIIFMFCNYALNYVIKFVISLDEKKEIIQIKINKREENEINKELYREMVSEELKNKYFLILLDFTVRQRKSSWDDDIDITSKDVQNEFFSLLEGNLDCESKFVDDKLLLLFDNFTQINEKLNVATTLLEALKNNFLKKNCAVDFIAVIDVYKNQSEINAKVSHLKNLIALKISNKYVCPLTFKSRYDLHSNKRYEIKSNGFYALNENEEIFIIEKK